VAVKTGLEEKPLWYGAGAGVLVAALIVLGFYMLMFKGMKEDIEGLRQKDSRLQEEILKGRAAERKLPQFREEVKRLELDLSKLLQILPSKRNTEELIKKIETLTRQGDFDLKKFHPLDLIPKDFYAEWPIEIALDGTYHNLALFFDRMSRFSRIINVENLKISAFNRPGKTISATFIAKTFIYTGDETPAPAAATPSRRPSALKRGADALKDKDIPTE
jgi:type IV pilus assembly protein PilO